MEYLTVNIVLRDLEKFKNEKKIRPIEDPKFDKRRPRKDTMELLGIYNRCVNQVYSGGFVDILKKACENAVRMANKNESNDKDCLEREMLKVVAEMQRIKNQYLVNLSKKQEEIGKIKNKLQELYLARQKLILDAEYQINNNKTPLDSSKRKQLLAKLAEKIKNIDSEKAKLDKALVELNNAFKQTKDAVGKLRVSLSAGKKEAKKIAGGQYHVHTLKTLLNALGYGRENGMIGTLTGAGKFLDESIHSVFGKFTSDTKKWIARLTDKNISHGYANSYNKIAEMNFEYNPISSGIDITQEKMNDFKKELDYIVAGYRDKLKTKMQDIIKNPKSAKSVVDSIKNFKVDEELNQVIGAVVGIKREHKTATADLKNFADVYFILGMLKTDPKDLLSFDTLNTELFSEVQYKFLVSLILLSPVFMASAALVMPVLTGAMMISFIVSYFAASTLCFAYCATREAQEQKALDNYLTKHGIKATV